MTEDCFAGIIIFYLAKTQSVAEIISRFLRFTRDNHKNETPCNDVSIIVHC